MIFKNVLVIFFLKEKMY